MNEFKMSLFLAPISPVKDGGTGQIIKPATLKPYKTMTLQEVYRTITANTRLQLLTDRVRRAFDSGDLSAYRALKQELLPYVTPLRHVRPPAQRQPSRSIGTRSGGHRPPRLR